MIIFMCKGIVGQEKGRGGFKDGCLLLIICAFAHGDEISDVNTQFLVRVKQLNFYMDAARAQHLSQLSLLKA